MDWLPNADVDDALEHNSPMVRGVTGQVDHVTPIVRHDFSTHNSCNISMGDYRGESGIDPLSTPITLRRSSRQPKAVHRPDTTGSESDVFGLDEPEAADPDYTPVSRKSQGPKPVYKTPNTRATDRNYYYLPDSVKRHVAAASPLGGRCVIEWCMPESGVDYCHVIPLATTGDVLDKLEYSWGIPRFTFNLDTRHNVFILSQKCHRLFDNDQFLFIPSLSALQELEKHRRGQPLPHFDNVKHEYTLLPRKAMQKVVFTRLNNLPNNDRAITPADHTILAYPFSDLTITSHVRPEYVIYNAGKKISRNTKELGDLYPTHILTFYKILGLYNHWMEDVPTEFLELEFETPSHTHTSASSRTNLRRRENPFLNTESPTPSSKRRNAQGGGGRGQGGREITNCPAGLTGFTYKTLQMLETIDQETEYQLKMSNVRGWQEQVASRRSLA